MLYINRQLSREASEVLYGCNRFTFEAAAVHTYELLSSLHPDARRSMISVSFARSSNIYRQGPGSTRHWEKLCTFIGHRMNLDTITLHVPLDGNLEVDETGPRLREYCDAPWCQGQRQFASLLMEAKIQKLRLATGATYLVGREDGNTGAKENGEVDFEDPLESFEVTQNLRYPRSDEDTRRELNNLEHKDTLYKGRPDWFAIRVALQIDQERRWQRLDFDVKGEDDTCGDVGTVLVLTRPLKVQQR